MTTQTTPLARLPRKSRRWPLIAVGVLLFAAGLVLGRIPLQPPGGTKLPAVKWDGLCAQAHQVYGGTVGETGLCHEAQTLTDLAGLFLVLGAAGIITGIVLGIRRNLRNDRDRECLATVPITQPGFRAHN